MARRPPGAPRTGAGLRGLSRGVRSAALATGLGSLLGIALALTSVRLLKGLLFGLSGTDPEIYLVAVATLVGSAMVAA